MPDKISSLTKVLTVGSGDLFFVSKSGTGEYSSKKISLYNLWNSIVLNIQGAGKSGYSGHSGGSSVGSGYSGYSGCSGPAGGSGFSGFDGLDGGQASSGYSGYSGYSGADSGYSGYSGAAATSGYSGYIGAGSTGSDARGWYLISGTYYSGSGLDTVYYNPYDEDSKFSMVSTWNSATKLSGSWWRPSTSNGYIYKCITGGTSTGVDPSDTNVGDNTSPGGTCLVQTLSKHILLGTSDLLNYLKKGSPIKYKISSSYYYGIVLDIDETNYYFVITGSPLTGDITELYVGNMDKVKEINLFAAEVWDGSSSWCSEAFDANDFLRQDADLSQYFEWLGPRARLVHYTTEFSNDDSYYRFANILINGTSNNASLENEGKGLYQRNVRYGLNWPSFCCIDSSVNSVLNTYQIEVCYDSVVNTNNVNVCLVFVLE